MSIWRKTIGGANEENLASILRAYNRWRAFVLDFPHQWQDRSELEAIFSPSVGHLSTYMAKRSSTGQPPPLEHWKAYAERPKVWAWIFR